MDVIHGEYYHDYIIILNSNMDEICFLYVLVLNIASICGKSLIFVGSSIEVKKCCYVISMSLWSDVSTVKIVRLDYITCICYLSRNV